MSDVPIWPDEPYARITQLEAEVQALKDQRETDRQLLATCRAVAIKLEHVAARLVLVLDEHEATQSD